MGGGDAKFVSNKMTCGEGLCPPRLRSIINNKIPITKENKTLI